MGTCVGEGHCSRWRAICTSSNAVRMTSAVIIFHFFFCSSAPPAGHGGHHLRVGDGVRRPPLPLPLPPHHAERLAATAAPPNSAPPSPDFSIQLSPRLTPPPVASFPRDRAEDLQAEASAMTRAANATVFSPDLLFSRYDSRPFKVALRAAEVLSKLGAFGLKLLLDERREQSSAMRRARVVEVRTILTRLGPTFVKIGQGLSTRPDLCPPEYLEELSELQDSLPTFPDEEAFACIEREFGFPLDSIYSTISPSPIAAASLGQVYKARLKYSGKLVAVKCKDLVLRTP